MIEFSVVAREFRSLIHRRRHVHTFLGSVFVATALFLHNVLKGNLPSVLDSIKSHVFVFYALVLLVPTLILALRMARLHSGMVIQGILYNRLMQNQDFTARGDPQRAAEHNFLGVSFLQFLLADFLAAFSAGILALGLDLHIVFAFLFGGVVLLALLGLYFHFHRSAVALAFQKIADDTCAPFTREDWQAHVSTSLEDANTGLISEIGFLGLIVFSMVEKLSGLNEIKPENAGPAHDDIKRFAPLVYALLMVMTGLFELVVYVRVRIAIGAFCLQLDPTDRPFRPLKLTDSLLGYLLMAFLFALSLHFLLLVVFPALGQAQAVLLALDAIAFLAVVAAEQMALVAAGRRYQQYLGHKVA